VEGVPRGALALGGAAFAAGIVLDFREAPRRVLAALAPAAALLGGGAAFADLLLGSGDLLVAVSWLVLGLQSLRFLLPKGSREGKQLVALSFLEFLAASSTEPEAWFALWAAAFLALTGGALWALHAWDRIDASPPWARPSTGRSAAAPVLLWCLLAGPVAAAALFLVVPRLRPGAILARPGALARATGFSDRISLSGVTGGKLDRTVEARVEFPSLPAELSPERLYLRGTAWDRFDGSDWSRSPHPARPVPRAGWIYLAGPAPRGEPAEAEVVLAASDDPALFTFGTPWTLEGHLGNVLTDGTGRFFLTSDGHPPMRYRTSFAPGGEGLPFDAPPPGPECLALPPGSGAIAALARRIAPPSLPVEERVRRLEEHFREGYRYTIEDPAPDLPSFLFDSRAGHCEHFSTSLCLLLRASGIPARVAGGYLGGEWNAIGGYLIVRRSDAHAWTEAWVGRRWRLLDATPPAGSGSPFLSRTGRAGFLVDWVRFRWEKYVLNYTMQSQAKAFTAGARSARRAFAGLGGAEGRIPWRKGLPFAAAAAALLALRSFLRRPAGRGDRAPRPGRRVGRLLRKLDDEGYRTSPGTLPEEMVRHAFPPGSPFREKALRFLSLYLEERFGPAPPAAGERREEESLAAELARAVPPRRAAAAPEGRRPPSSGAA
jgi:transglutaminase-like putative cysteine protease